MKHYEVSGAGPGRSCCRPHHPLSGPRDPLLWPSYPPMAQAQCVQGLLLNPIAHVQGGIYATPAFWGRGEGGTFY